MLLKITNKIFLGLTAKKESNKTDVRAGKSRWPWLMGMLFLNGGGTYLFINGYIPEKTIMMLVVLFCLLLVGTSIGIVIERIIKFLKSKSNGLSLE